MYPKFSLHRHGEKRTDTKKIEHLFHSFSTKILLSQKGKFCSISDGSFFFSIKELESTFCFDSFEISKLYKQSIYLGEHDNDQYFLISLSEEYFSHINDLTTDIDLRTIALISNPLNVGILFYAQGLINWHFSHQFCAKCGHQTKMMQAGHSRQCTNTECNKEHFPRIEPAVITAIETEMKGTRKILLARQQNWPENRYSVIAGFSEHGESLESLKEKH